MTKEEGFKAKSDKGGRGLKIRILTLTYFLNGPIHIHLHRLGRNYAVLRHFFRNPLFEWELHQGNYIHFRGRDLIKDYSEINFCHLVRFLRLYFVRVMSYSYSFKWYMRNYVNVSNSRIPWSKGIMKALDWMISRILGKSTFVIPFVWW